MGFDKWRTAIKWLPRQATSKHAKADDSKPLPNRDGAKEEQITKKDSNLGMRYGWFEGLCLKGRRGSKKVTPEITTTRGAADGKMEEVERPMGWNKEKEKKAEADGEDQAEAEPCPLLDDSNSNPFDDPIITHDTIPHVEWDENECRQWLLAFMENKRSTLDSNPSWMDEASIIGILYNSRITEGWDFYFVADREFWQLSGGRIGRAIYQRLIEIRCSDQKLVDAGVELEATRTQMIREALIELGVKLEPGVDEV
jgi:hypothetical protein